MDSYDLPFYLYPLQYVNRETFKLSNFGATVRYVMGQGSQTAAVV